MQPQHLPLHDGEGLTDATPQKDRGSGVSDNRMKAVPPCCPWAPGLSRPRDSYRGVRPSFDGSSAPPSAYNNRRGAEQLMPTLGDVVLAQAPVAHRDGDFGLWRHRIRPAFSWSSLRDGEPVFGQAP